MKQKLLLITALVFGVLAFMLTYSQINAEKKKFQSLSREVAVITALRDISENEKITDDMVSGVKVQRFQSQLASSREIPLESKMQIIGRKAQFQIRKGSIIQWDDLQNSVSGNRSGLASVVNPGFRAVAINVDQTASVSGLIRPNNYVDIIGTFKFPDMRGDSSLDTITITILQNVRVMATGDDYGMRAPEKGFARSYSTITLELTPKEVEMIVFASQKGRIHLTLRNYEDTAVTRDIQSINWKYLQNNVNKYNEDRARKIMKRY